jgi:hypothetical protein
MKLGLWLLVITSIAGAGAFAESWPKSYSVYTCKQKCHSHAFDHFYTRTESGIDRGDVLTAAFLSCDWMGDRVEGDPTCAEEIHGAGDADLYSRCVGDPPQSICSVTYRSYFPTEITGVIRDYWTAKGTSFSDADAKARARCEARGQSMGGSKYYCLRTAYRAG